MLCILKIDIEPGSLWERKKNGGDFSVNRMQLQNAKMCNKNERESEVKRKLLQFLCTKVSV